MKKSKNINDIPIREILIDNIIDMAGDEYESSDSLIELAKKSDRELILDVINISQYFKELSN